MPAEEQYLEQLAVADAIVQADDTLRFIAEQKVIALRYLTGKLLFLEQIVCRRRFPSLGTTMIL